MPARTIVADPKLIDDPSATVAALTPILALDATEASELTARLGDPDSRFAYVARRVDDATATAIEELSLPGLLFLDEHERVEPADDLARPVIAPVDVAGLGLTGLEAPYDAPLPGEPGALVIKKDPEARPP